ncbi:MAG: anti-sigma factor [Ilumatobacteraceae bacterium]
MIGSDDERRASAGDPSVAPDDELGASIDTLLADAALWVEVPDGLDERVVAAVRSEAAVGEPPTPTPNSGPRRTSVRPALLGAAAAILLLFGGVVVLSALSGASGTDRFSADLVSTGLIADVDGSIEVTSFSSGLRIDLDAPSLPRRDGGRFYEGWLRTDDDKLVPVGTFHDGDGVTLWAGIEPERVVAFSITMERAVAPASPDQSSSGDVVLKADVSP